MEKVSPTNLPDFNQPPDLRSPLMVFAQKVLIAGGIIAALGLVLAGLWAGAEVFLLVFAGFLLSVSFRSLSRFLSEHLRVSENWALVIVLLLFVVGISLGVWLLAPSVQKQFDELSEQLPVVYENARWQLAQYSLGRKIIERMPSAQQFIMGGESSSVFGRVTGLFSTALGIITNVLIVLVVAIYFAFNPSLYSEGIIKLVPKKRERRAREIVQMIEITLRRYLTGVSASMLINGTMTFLGLWFLGIPFAIPLAIISGLLAIIPNIGPVIAAVPAILVALSLSPWQALYVLILYLGVQNLEGFVISPLIQQRAVSLPPVLVIASQIVLAVIFGFLGLLLAVPIVAIGLILIKMIYVEDILDKQVVIKGEDKVEVSVADS